MDTLENFYTGAQQYVALFDAFARKHHLVGAVAADHICYKCGSHESYLAIRALFERSGVLEFSHTAIIAGRPITYLKFAQPIETTLGPIRFLELSDQKPNNSQVDGFDHIEAYPTTQSYDEMVAQLAETEQVIYEERPHHPTHDIDIGGGFLFRCCHGPLVTKIRDEEMR